MLKEELIEALEILERNGVSEKDQRDILFHGLRFDYTWGDPDPQHLNRTLNIFKVANLFKLFNDNNIDIRDMKKDEYGDIVRAVADADKKKNVDTQIIVIKKKKNK